MTGSEPIPSRQTADDATRLRTIMEAAVDGVITIGERGLIEDVNSAAERLFGYTASEMVGQNVNMLMPAPFQQEHDGYLRNYVEGGPARIIGIGREVEGLRKDGSTFPLYLAVSEARVAGRRLFTGFVHDLTDVKQAQQQATHLGRILEDSLNEIFVFDVDTLEFVFANRGALENLGYRFDELTIRTPVDIKPHYSRDDFESLVAGLRSGEESVLEFETVHERKDGSHYHVLVRLQIAEWEERSVFVAIVLDITDRQRQETELKIRDRAIQSASEGIVIADARQPGNPIVFVNEAFTKISGYDWEESVGRSCEILCGDGADAVSLEGLKSAVTQGLEFRDTVQCRRKNGTAFWNKLSVAPIANSRGNVTHLVAVMEDVSLRRQAEEQLLQSERLAAIGQMVTGLAHESRNALQRAQACLDMLTLDLEDQPEQLELTEKTRRALTDLYRHYEEVRNYAAPIVLEKRPIDVVRLIRQTWADMEAVRGRRAFEFQIVDHGVPLTVPADDHRLRQVFLNIMENSVSACGDSGRIDVECALQSGGDQTHCCLTFQDSGPGFDATTTEAAFQPFFTTKQKGTGLGMAISKRIIEAHGGHITIVPCERGARIEVQIPC
ncbi:MAG: PAS domain S-box protein [Planctomycetaceae bacterium]|nr:PAS domain S-box protein [Planctomycetaceae bacterium]